MYTYNATLVRVVDGDTVYFTVDLGFCITTKLDFRLAKINAPEMKTPEGPKAKAELERLLGLGAITIQSLKLDKYGRWIAQIFVKEGDKTIDVNQTLLDGGFAIPYKS